MYNKSLLSLAYRISHDTEISKESTQETWIEVFHNLNKYKENKGAFSSWVNTILVRRTWHIMNKKIKNQELSDQVIHPPCASDIVDKLSCEELLQEMECIPTASRVVFKLYVIEGYKHKEISELLNISASASRSHLTKARKIMKHRYAIINKITINEL